MFCCKGQRARTDARYLNSSSLEVYYINMRQNKERKFLMEENLRKQGILEFRRIEAVDGRTFTIPFSGRYPPNIGRRQFPCPLNESLHVHSPFANYASIRINRVCINRQATDLEVAVTLSHMSAIVSAVQSNNARPYALILEDDVELALNIDFGALISSLPGDFRILQLVISHPSAYSRDPHTTTQVYQKRGRNFWCTGAYIIHKSNMHRSLHKLMEENKQPSDAFTMDLLSARYRGSPYMRGVRGGICLDQAGNEIYEYPCIHSLVSADFYIYNLAPLHSYATTVPLFSFSRSGYNSTINEHQSVADNYRLDEIRQLISQINTGEIAAPFFVKSNSDAPLRSTLNDAKYLNASSLDVYYINMQHHKDRMLSLESTLRRQGISEFHRIEAVNKNTFTIPSSGRHAPHKSLPGGGRRRVPCTWNQSISINASFASYSSIRIKRMCINKQANDVEVACLLSHLSAIISAISSSDSRPYALILEDDVELALKVDFGALISSLPSNFRVLQLVVLNPDAYTPEFLATTSGYRRRGRGFYSTGAYIIHKGNMRQSLQTLFDANSNHNAVFTMDLLTARFMRGEQGGICFDPEGNALYEYPCVHAPLVAADFYIYYIAVNHTYATTVPLFQFSPHSYNSTIDAKHSARDTYRLDKIQHLVSQLKSGSLKAPFYVKG